ncbi:hypothetical protein ACFXJ8_27625 [Nonomuraea sp. NPDC059194]|uniref:hypothetical protein n=1 Tax=Nonomuraea sp. NPDC059194 TaxID=3346764 RepID=UPI0036A89D6A
MDPDTLRGGTGDVYWRRRMTVLVAVLVVVAFVAWACSATGGPQHASNAEKAATPSAEPVLAGLPSVTMTPTPKPSKARVTASPSPSPSPSPTQTQRVRRAGMPCEEKDLVLNLEQRQEVYSSQTQPTFMLTLVNTGPVMCTADVGPRAMEIRITSGSDRVWSTSDCVSGDGVEIRKLERGIPYVRSLDWDRRRSGADCSGERAAALPGTYVAVVRTGGMRSRKAVFHLR